MRTYLQDDFADKDHHEKEDEHVDALEHLDQLVLRAKDLRGRDSMPVAAMRCAVGYHAG